MSVLTERWIADGGGNLLRRGRISRGDMAIIRQDFESLDVAASLGTGTPGVAAFRQVVGDPDFGYLQAQHALMGIVDKGGTDGKVMRVTYTNDWYQGGGTGIAYAPKLSRDVEAARVSFSASFNPGFFSGKGGKFGPGLGWKNDQVSSPSTGGTSNNHSGSFRWMWRDDFRLSPYLYDANGTSGIGLATSPSSPQHPSDNNKHNYELDLVMNTASVVAGSGTPPSPGVLGVDYLADGILTCRVDGETIYHATNRVHRKYADTLITHLTWSWFRGGGDSTWDGAGGPHYLDLYEYAVIEL